MPEPTTLTTVIRDHPAIGQVLDRLHELQRDLERSKAALDTARDELAAAIHEAAAPYRVGTAPLPLELLRTLYWEMPAARVRDLARAVGMSSAELTTRVGPRTEPGSCYRCGREVMLARRSRSDRPQGACDRCRILDAITNAARPGPGRGRALPWDDTGRRPLDTEAVDLWLQRLHLLPESEPATGNGDVEGRP